MHSHLLDSILAFSDLSSASLHLPLRPPKTPTSLTFLNQPDSMTLEDSSSVPTKSPSAATGLSTQHSPVTYLLCGMAAMSLLIGSALLILIISYWQYKARLDRAESERRGDLEVGGEQANFGAGEGLRKVGYREKIAVIMAGDENPRFLATPRRYKRFFSTDDEAEKQSVDGERAKERISNQTASHQDV